MIYYFLPIVSMKNFKNLLLTAWTALCIVSCGDKVTNDAKANLLKEFAEKWYTEVVDRDKEHFLQSATVDAGAILKYVQYDKEIKEKGAFMTIVAPQDTLFWTLTTAAIQDWQSTTEVEIIEISHHKWVNPSFRENTPLIEKIGVIAETPNWDLVMWEPTTEPESNIVNLDNRKPKDTTPQVSQEFTDVLQRIAGKFYQN